MWLLILSAQYTLLCALSLLLSMSAFEAATLCSPPVDRWAPPSPQAKSSSPVLLLLCRSDNLLFFAGLVCAVPWGVGSSDTQPSP